MELKSYAQIEESVQEAELVLVGLGEEWQVSLEEMMEDTSFQEKMTQLQQIRTQEEVDYLFPFLAAEYDQTAIPKRLEQAYVNLKKLLDHKNYFIVSTTMDSYLEKYEFQKNRYVNPCGTFQLLQCGMECEDTLCKVEDRKEEIQELLNQALQQDTKLQPLYCKTCNTELAYNTIFAEKYQEKGYLPQWETYMKWLQGTVNKKLTVLELGVGMQFPSVIRWPFEKTVLYNQKSTFFRIHKTLPMLSAEIAERGYSRQEDAVTLLSTCKRDDSSL